jgi:hypothetical protein
VDAEAVCDLLLGVAVVDVRAGSAVRIPRVGDEGCESTVADRSALGVFQMRRVKA